MFTVANKPICDKYGQPVYIDAKDKKKGWKSVPVLVEKDPCMIFEDTSFKGRAVPSEAFIRVLVIKPLFDKALLASFTTPDVKITDVYLETKGDARQVLLKLCERWNRTYRNAGYKCMSEDRIARIMSFFKFDGNRLSIAEPTNGKGTAADVNAVSEPKAETIAKN